MNLCFFSPGRYDLTLPELRCGGCCASWTPGLYDVQVSGYWPATIHFHTIYDVAIFQAFREMNLAAPGISRLTFMRMLEAQTTAHGRVGWPTVHNIYHYLLLILHVSINVSLMILSTDW